MFKAGDKVKCVDVENNVYITKGHVYTVAAAGQDASVTGGDYIRIKSHMAACENSYYSARLFGLYEETQKPLFAFDILKKLCDEEYPASTYEANMILNKVFDAFGYQVQHQNSYTLVENTK